ncbi:hypothetical protein ACOMHN_032518 [Nucella lapillus]
MGRKSVSTSRLRHQQTLLASNGEEERVYKSSQDEGRCKAPGRSIEMGRRRQDYVCGQEGWGAYLGLVINDPRSSKAPGRHNTSPA